MDLIVAIAFGAGVAAFAYAKLGRRVGYGNQRNVWTIVGVAFVLSSAFFFTIARFVINLH